MHVRQSSITCTAANTLLFSNFKISRQFSLNFILSFFMSVNKFFWKLKKETTVSSLNWAFAMKPQRVSNAESVSPAVGHGSPQKLMRADDTVKQVVRLTPNESTKIAVGRVRMTPFSCVYISEEAALSGLLRSWLIYRHGAPQFKSIRDRSLLRHKKPTLWQLLWHGRFATANAQHAFFR